MQAITGGPVCAHMDREAPIFTALVYRKLLPDEFYTTSMSDTQMLLLFLYIATDSRTKFSYFIEDIQHRGKDLVVTYL
jgi:hypothetical protein